MNAMFPMKLLAPMVLILGAALPASAQGPSSSVERVGCYIQTTGVPRVPPEFQARFLTTDSIVECPANPPASNIIVECTLLIGPGWPSGLKINTKQHACLIDGLQCDVPNPPGEDGFVSDNTQLLIEPVVIGVNVFGNARLRCQNKDAD